MSGILRRATVVVAVAFALVAAASSYAAAAEKPRALRIGVKAAPPFAMKAEDGTWHGISIDLWRMIAEELGLAYELREYDLESLIEKLRKRQLDAGVAAITVTAERAAVMDFTHPFHTSGLGIAVSDEGVGLVRAVLTRVFSKEFATAIGGLALFMLAAGALLWIVERRRNPTQFGGSTLEGLGSGFWWSAVTMTTVGYGDKAPVTFAGRLIGLVWMFTGVITISTFTASIASVLTLSSLSGPVAGPNDLGSVRTAAAAASTSAEYLKQRRIRYSEFASPEEALGSLAAGEVEAVVHDAPILRYLVYNGFADKLQVLPMTFERQDYAIGLPAGSPLRQDLNRVLLERITSPTWQATLARYLGD